MKHNRIVAPGAAHSVGFRQTTDPTLVPANDVQPNAVWVEVDGSDNIVAVRIRNAANTAWNSFSVAPSGAAGGVLSGTYPNPGFAADMATQAELDAAVLFAIARANHTGTQLAATISDLVATIRAQVEAELIAGTNITITPAGAGATRTLTLDAAGGSGGLVPLGEQSGSGVASLAFTGLMSATYDTYKLIFEGIKPAADARVGIQFSDDNGATWAATNYDRGGHNKGVTTSFSQYLRDTGLTVASICQATCDSVEESNGEVTLYRVNTSGKKVMTVRAANYEGDGNLYDYSGTAVRTTAMTINAVRLIAVGQNISGVARLYGVKKS